LVDYFDLLSNRTSEASYKGGQFSRFGGPADESDTMLWAPANTNRIYSGGELLIEGPETNDIRKTEDLTHQGTSIYQWNTSAGGIVTDQIAAPDGAVDADKVTTPAGLVKYRTWPGTNNDHEVSIWIRGVSGSGTVDLYAKTGGTFTTCNFTTEWQRFSHKDSFSGAAFDLVLQNGSAQYYAWGAQHHFPTSGLVFPDTYIRADGAASVTRAGDWAYRTTIPPGLDTGAWEFDYWPEHNSAEGRAQVFLHGCGGGSGAGGVIDMRRAPAWLLFYFPGDGSGERLTLPAYNRNDKITIRVDNNTKRGTAWINDVLVGSSTASTGGNWPSPGFGNNVLSIGSSTSGTLPAWGLFSPIRRV
jgi:hypothetical protein